MKFIAFLLNVVLFGFTCLVLLTDGISTGPAYLVLALLLLLVPVLSVAVFFLNREVRDWFGFSWKKKEKGEEGRDETLSAGGYVLNAVALSGNILLLGFSIWAFISQYPHPREEGFAAYVTIVILTPVISSIVMIRNMVKG
jgi:hypothetical protein